MSSDKNRTAILLEFPAGSSMGFPLGGSMCSAAGILFLSLNRLLCNYAIHQMILSGGKPYAAWHHIILCTYFLPYRRQFAFLDKPNDQCDHQTDQKICRYPEKARGLFGKVIGIVCLSCSSLCHESLS